VFVSRLSWYTFDNADFLVAGKVLGTSLLGAYRLAWTFASMPLDKIVSLVGRVTPAVLSSVQNDSAELRRYVLRITEAVSLVVFPASVGLALVADDFVWGLLGGKWLAAVWPLRILAAYTCVRGVSPIWSQVLTVTGETRFLMGVSALGALTLPLGFWAGSHWGITGIALAWVILHPFLVVAPIYRRLSRGIDLPFVVYGQALMPAAKATAVMAAVVVLTRLLTVGSGHLVRLGAEVIAGCLSYLAVILVVSGSRLSSLLRSLVRGSAPSD
jgi:PST family polysaccharide transporter